MMEETKSWMGRICPLISVEFYRPYFDLSTEEVVRRIIVALVPFKGNFHERVKSGSSNQQHDLYICGVIIK